MATGCWTLNHVREDFLLQAHQSSARYSTSEFEAVGLEEEYGLLAAPYIKRAAIKIALELAERIDIASNGTHFLVGAIREIILPEEIVTDDGSLNLEEAGTLTVCGLDSYHKTERLKRLSYAKPDRQPQEIQP